MSALGATSIWFRDGILCERSEHACGGNLADCRRICGIPQTSEGTIEEMFQMINNVDGLSLKVKVIFRKKHWQFPQCGKHLMIFPKYNLNFTHCGNHNVHFPLRGKNGTK